MKVAIIGGGAAGFFSAIKVKETYPDYGVVIFEKSAKVLSKVLVSGGRRCNVTNGCTSVPELIKAYPRGGSALKKLLPVFGTQHTIQWFEKRGVPMVVQPDNCVFPVSQNAQSIVDCFLQQCRKLGVEIKTNCGVKAIKLAESGLVLHFEHDKNTPEYFDKVIVTTGGSPKMDGLKWLKDLGHSIEIV